LQCWHICAGIVQILYLTIPDGVYHPGWACFYSMGIHDYLPNCVV